METSIKWTPTITYHNQCSVLNDWFNDLHSWAMLLPKYCAGIARCVHLYLYRSRLSALQWEDRTATISTKSNEDAPIRPPDSAALPSFLLLLLPSPPPLQWDLPSSALGGPGALLPWKCARMWGPWFSGAPAGRRRLSPRKDHRDEEEQRAAGTMRSRLPRTACLLRLFTLCILLAHSAAYFGSVSLWPLLPVNDSTGCSPLWQTGDCVNLASAGQVYARVILLVVRVCGVAQRQND